MTGRPGVPLPPDPTEPLPVYDDLATERLRLRRFVASDATPFATYRSDPDTARWQSWRTPYPVDLARTFVAEVAVETPGRPGGAFQYALERHAEPGLIGDVMLATGADRRLVEVGVTLAPQVRGQGLATEALARLVDHLFTEVGGVQRVEARCDGRNTASIALFERLGFRREAHLVAAVWVKGEWTDDVVLAVLADEWSRVRR
jgi:RimJ/RimL family protein N-acetyltransferase